MKVRHQLPLAALWLTLPITALAQAAAPAAAPAPPKASVGVYGTLNVNYQTTMAKGATDPSKSVSPRQTLSTDSSNVGVKAQAEVAGGLDAIAQCETSAAINGIGPAGICGRNSRVGLSSATLGTLFVGNWDTPFKAGTYGTKVDDPFLDTDVFGFQSIMGSPGFNARSGGWVTATPGSTGSTVLGFDTRASNSVAYWSPNFSGLSFKLQYAADAFANQRATLNPNLFSAGVNYDWGGLSVVASIDRREDAGGLSVINGAERAFGATEANPATIGSVDTAWRAGAGYELDSAAGATTVSFLIDQLILQQDHAPIDAIKDYKRVAWQIAAKHRYGDHELRFRYDMADKGKCTVANGSAIGCSTGGYGANQFTAGYAYYLSKSAQAYLSWTKIFNDRNASYTLGIGGAPAVAGATARGADPTAVGLGLRYAF